MEQAKPSAALIPEAVPETVSHRSTRKSRMAFWGSSLILLAMALGSFYLDLAIRDFWSTPLRSGQLRTTLRAMQCWGEAATLAVLSLAIWRLQPGRGRAVAVLSLATLLTAATVDTIKPWAGRLRPDAMPAQIASSNSWAEVWQCGTGRNSSFPSGHTATAFAFARGLSLMHPSLHTICLLAASSTAISRMHEQRHFCSDCCFGALLGWYLAGFVWFLLMPNRATEIGLANVQNEPTNQPISSRAA